jgi:hypothetical protein
LVMELTKTANYTTDLSTLWNLLPKP